MRKLKKNTYEFENDERIYDPNECNTDNIKVFIDGKDVTSKCILLVTYQGGSQ